jgi:acetoin utilization deacetylase AcuC-like enzyme
MSPGHPESPDRLRSIESELQRRGLWDRLEIVEAPQATREQVSRVHSAEHVDRIFKHAPSEGTYTLDPDTAMNPHTLPAALHAAGAMIDAVDAVLAGRAPNAFCAVRPPGHHAERDKAMGFCFFNNIAVGAAHALAEHGLERVAVLDFDVHHGNGTQDIFEGDERVLFCSTHQHPFYPFTGQPSQTGNVVNVPLPAGSGSEAFQAAVLDRWLPAVEAFNPQLVLVSAGFDAHRDDPLALLNFGDEDFAWVTGQIVEWARRHCEGRIVSTLEGGYNLQALGRSVAVHIEGMLNTNPEFRTQNSTKTL